MDREKCQQRGIVILEAAAALLIALTVLLGAWGAIDLYQQGLNLEEVVENAYYDGVVPGYRYDSFDGAESIHVDHQNILSFIQKQVGRAAEEFRTQGVTEDSFAIQGGVAELRWRSGATPSIERLILTAPVGDGTLSAKVSDFERGVDDFIRRMSKENTSSSRFIRPDLWSGVDGVDSSLSSSIVLVGFSAARSVNGGMAAYLMKSLGDESIIRRSSFNVLRRDL